MSKKPIFLATLVVATFITVSCAVARGGFSVPIEDDPNNGFRTENNQFRTTLTPTVLGGACHNPPTENEVTCLDICIDAKGQDETGDGSAFPPDEVEDACISICCQAGGPSDRTTQCLIDADEAAEGLSGSAEFDPAFDACGGG